MTVYYASFVLFMLIVIFGVTYKIKGLKAALVVAGLAFIGFSVLYMGLIYLIVNSMD